MTRSRSYLNYRRIETSSSANAGSIITLHGAGGSMDDMIPFVRDLSATHAIAAPRAFWGVHDGTDVIGSTWYRFWQVHQPEPSTFGYSIVELERFILDEIDRSGDQYPILIGASQGGVMALSAALAFHDILSGVIAIDGCLPTIHGWEMPTIQHAGFPVLLIRDPNLTSPPSTEVEATQEILERRSYDVECHQTDQASALGPSVHDVVQRWLNAHSNHPTASLNQST